MLDADECAAVDANTGPVRTRNGTVPDAVRLSHYRDYDLAELPPDRQRALVFYCANEQCTASDVAARRAARAGWRRVSVMRSGIAGWTAAGHPTQPVP
jgi:rhodanese-related sulfurtransferase